MSRIGNKTIEVPAAVKVDLTAARIKLQGPKGALEWGVPAQVEVTHDSAAKRITVKRRGEDKFARAMHGTARALINNMVRGVSTGYDRGLELYGTGYSVKVEGKNLTINVGFAKPVQLPIPAGVTVAVEVPQTRGNDVPAKFKVSGPDKQVVGQFARSIKDVRPPEPYQGKGFRYEGEQIRRKQGKAFAGGAAG